MSDWTAGDLAPCVDDSPCRCGCGIVGVTTVAGRVYRVQALRLCPVEGFFGLVLENVQALPLHGRGENAARFRKILPDKHEDCEPEFVTLLNRIKRKVSA